MKPLHQLHENDMYQNITEQPIIMKTYKQIIKNQ